MPRDFFQPKFTTLLESYTYRIDTGKLTEEHHDGCVHNRASCARHGEKVQPDEALQVALLLRLIFHGVAHDEELFSVLVHLQPTNALPHLEGLKYAPFVHQEPRAFGHKDHAGQ